MAERTGWLAPSDKGQPDPIKAGKRIFIIILLLVILAALRIANEKGLIKPLMESILGPSS